MSFKKFIDLAGATRRGLGFALLVAIAAPCGAAPLLSFDTHIAFEKIANLRDLGGLVTSDGHKILLNRIYRSANPGMASPLDIERLKTFHLDAVVDLRTPSERSPEAERDFASAFPWISDPVLSGNNSSRTFLKWLSTATPQDARGFMIKTYQQFPVDFQPQFKALLTLAEQNKVFMYHCTQGKDRTGFATALLLSALGVDRATIMDNYLESNRWNAASNAAIIKKIRPTGIQLAVLEQLLTVEPAYLNAAFTVIDQKYGGMDAYLRDVLKVDVAAIRRNYLTR